MISRNSGVNYIVQSEQIKSLNWNNVVPDITEPVFEEREFLIKPEEYIEITLCGKKVEAENVVFGGFSFTKAFERIVKENVEASFCGNEGNLNLDFYDRVLGVIVKEQRWNQIENNIDYIPEKYGPTNMYVMSLYSKSDKNQLSDSFSRTSFVYKFDFNKKEVLLQMAIDGSFRKVGLIKESDFNDSLKSLSVVDELKIRFKNIDKTSDIQSDQSIIWWNDENGYNLNFPANESFFVAKEEKNHIDQSLIAYEYFYKELALVKQVFTNRGFILNKNNSSDDFTDNRFYDYIQAYERGNELCVVLVNLDCTSYRSGNYDKACHLVLSCGNSLEEAQIEQIPLLNALDYKNRNNIAMIRNQLGDFYEVIVSGRRGGSTAIMKKEGENYRVLYISQEDPFCSLIEEENIPNEVLKAFEINGCFGDNGSNYKRFNE